MDDRKIERKVMKEELWGEVLAWRNEPHVIAWSRTNRAISEVEHAKWFENRRLRINKEPVFSYHHSNAFIGMARIDKVSEAIYEVSLIINATHQNKGFGRYILSDICEYFSNTLTSPASLIAVVHVENTKSQRLFESVGFRFVSQQSSFKNYVYQDLK